MNSITVPFGTPSREVISGAGLCVGPMMKLPSAFVGGIAPSGSSFAVTYPGVLGSRVGGGVRSDRCVGGADWAQAGTETATTPTKMQSQSIAGWKQCCHFAAF